MDIKYIIYSYLLIVISIGIIYMKIEKKTILTDIVAILSGLTISFGLINYISAERQAQIQNSEQKKKNYIDNVSQLFIKINSIYLKYPKELNDLFYEFYGYNSFPLENEENHNNENDAITSIEFTMINIIIESLNNMYIINPEIFDDLNIRNRILCFINSKKFKKILSQIKNNYSYHFINKLLEEQIITNKEIDVENVNIPYQHTLNPLFLDNKD